MSDNENILFLTDIIEQKLRKERELEYYKLVKTQLEEKMILLEKEIRVTDYIISAIHNEKDELVLEHLKNPEE